MLTSRAQQHAVSAAAGVSARHLAAVAPNTQHWHSRCKQRMQHASSGSPWFQPRRTMSISAMFGGFKWPFGSSGGDTKGGKYDDILKAASESGYTNSCLAKPMTLAKAVF